MEQAAALGVFGALQKMTTTFTGILPILILLSLIAGVWIYYLLVARHEPTRHTLKESIQRFLRFDTMLWPLIGRVLYISTTIFLILSGLITMVAVNFLSGLVGTFLLLILVRVLSEMAMVVFSIHSRLPEKAAPSKIAGKTVSPKPVPAPSVKPPKTEKRVDNESNDMLE